MNIHRQDTVNDSYSDNSHVTQTLYIEDLHYLYAYDSQFDIPSISWAIT